MKDLKNKFYITKDKILRNINNKENRNKIFEKKASSKSWILTLSIIISYLLITVPPIVTYSDPAILLFAITFPAIGFSVIIAGFAELIRSKFKSIIAFLFTLFWGSMFGGIVWISMVLPCLVIDTYYLVSYVLGVIAIAVIIVCRKYLEKRTAFGNEMLGKIRGFKNFLETAEKERLETLVADNPTYFYDVLPYAYVLDVSDVWIKNFEAINIESPDWYDSPNTFDLIVFNSFVNSAMSSANSAMSSSPSSSSGGSSGGGFSGGGSGGGGGSSW